MQLSDHHPFRSAEARRQYLASYDQRAQRWPVACETRMVETSFGRTFVRTSGPAEAPPLVLLHGAMTNSLMWEPFIEALSACCWTYAVDGQWDIGRSVYTRPLKGPDDYVSWLHELFTALSPGARISLVGISLGAWQSCLYALRHPDRVAKMVVLSLAGVVLRLRWMFMFRTILSALSRGLQRGYRYWMFGDSMRKGGTSRRLVEEITDDGYLAMRILLRGKIVNPRVFTDPELQSLQMPILYLVGEHERIYSPRKAVQRLNRVAPGIKTEIIPQVGHDMMAQAELVSRKAVEFLKQG